MFSHRFSLYVDNVVGAVLLLIGTGMALADALGRAPDGTGSLGIGVIAMGKLLCINSMFRHYHPSHERDGDEFDFDGEYARVHRIK